MSKEVWILLYIPPAWQWGLNGDAASWYSSAKLFRQKKQNDWSAVLHGIKEILKTS